MSKTTYHTVRLEPTTKDYIEEVHENHEQYNSTKRFTEQAVAKNAEYIERQVKGAADLRQLIQVLCRVDGISTELPEGAFNTKLRDENLSSATKIDISHQPLNSIDKVTRSTELTKGGVIRLCIIRELYRLSSFSWLLHEPRQSDIRNSWENIEENVEILFSSLLSRLETKLVTNFDSTRQKIAADPKAEEALNAHYQNYFQDSAGYERLQEDERGKAILAGLEDLISECG
jgi:hypothetical protein